MKESSSIHAVEHVVIYRFSSNLCFANVSVLPVSYTHLDVYKRQRPQGVESKIRELGLCLMPEWVDYGNYEYRSGETYALSLIHI